MGTWAMCLASGIQGRKAWAFRSIGGSGLGELPSGGADWGWGAGTRQGRRAWTRGNSARRDFRLAPGDGVRSGGQGEAQWEGRRRGLIQGKDDDSTEIESG